MIKILLTSLLFLKILQVVGQEDGNYNRLIDSADVSLSTDAKKTLEFLNSIPKPIGKHIEGKVGKYYLLRGYAYERTGDEAQTFQNLLHSVRYAEEEKDYEVAGGASIALFKEVYFAKKDTSAYKHLKAAEKYYSLTNDKIGAIEVKQMPAYVAFTEGKFELSNKLILQHLDDYKNLKEDAYFNLFANFMLASNYTHLNDLKSANIYLKSFQSLKSNPTIADFNYKSFDVTLKICFAKLHLDKKQVDSSLYYLSSASRLRDYMNVTSMGEYYSFSSEVYQSIENNSVSAKYLDSLKGFQRKIFADNQDASLALDEVLLDAEKTLNQEKEQTNVVKKWLLILGVISIGLLLLFVFGYKKIKVNRDEISQQKKDFSTLKSNNEKLKVRTQELESYIEGIRVEVKQIATIKDEEIQKNKIRSLYRTINAEAINLKDSGENHVNILKKLNETFFNKINKDYPGLTDTEFLLCYYLLLEFKNKEIAFFLNRSIRSIESQRFRVSKKMNLESSKMLIEYLNENYSS